MTGFIALFSLRNPLFSFARSNTLKDKLTFNKLATREERETEWGRESKKLKNKIVERERESNRAWSLLVPPVHTLPLIPVLLYPLHLKQGCLLWAKTWLLLDHPNTKLTYMPRVRSYNVWVCMSARVLQQVVYVAGDVRKAGEKSI